VRGVRSTRYLPIRYFGVVAILFVNLVYVKDKPSINTGHFSYRHVVVDDFEFDGRVESLGNAKCSGS